MLSRARGGLSAKGVLAQKSWREIGGLALTDAVCMHSSNVHCVREQVTAPALLMGPMGTQHMCKDLACPSA